MTLGSSMLKQVWEFLFIGDVCRMWGCMPDVGVYARCGGVSWMWVCMQHMGAYATCGGVWQMWGRMPVVGVYSGCGDVCQMWGYMPDVEIYARCGGVWWIWGCMPHIVDLSISWWTQNLFLHVWGLTNGAVINTSVQVSVRVSVSHSFGMCLAELIDHKDLPLLTLGRSWRRPHHLSIC